MKRLLFGLLAVTTMVMASCSKDAKINRRLDGEWKVTSYDGKPLENGESRSYSFEKTDKLSGKGTYTASGTSDGVTYSVSLPFTYTVKNEQVTSITTVGNFQDDPETYNVLVYKKDRIEFKDSEGVITVLQPK